MNVALTDHDEARPDVIDRTTLQPLVHRSPRRMYAASALAALGAGFGLAAAGMFAAGGCGSRLSRLNGALSAGSLIAAAALRLTSRVTERVALRTSSPLGDRNVSPPLDYSIIVPVYNRPDHIRALLGRLAVIATSVADLGAGEIVVVDDGSTDDTVAVVEALATQMPIMTRVVRKVNGGPGSCRNTGFACARGRIGISIDSDCEPEASWLPAMLAAARSDSKLIVFARVRSGKRPVYPLENLPDRKGFVTASFAMERRSYLELGGCNERYGNSHEDLDFVQTALARGFDVGHAREAWIAHPLRRETIRSMWRVGLNSRYGNLFALRHGAYAARATKPTPYYFFGIGSNCGSSVAFVVTASNVALAAALALIDGPSRAALLRDGAKALAALAGAYVAALAALGIVTRASARDLPAYIATLGTFQLATLVGHLRGTREFGLFLL